MREVRNLLIGMEINRESSQICYYDRRQQDPVSVTTKVGTNIYAFPTKLSLSKNGEWYYGVEADYFAKEQGAAALPDLLHIADSGNRTTLFGKSYEAAEILMHFLKGALGLLGLSDVAHSTLGICITTRKLTKGLAETFRGALQKLGFRDPQILIEDDKESFYYYCYSQKPSVWTRNMALILFHKNDVKFYTMSELPEARPHLVTIHFTNGITLNEEPEKRDAQFSDFVRACCRGQLFSGIFLTGEGFDKSWARESIRTLTECGRHVYEGDNLFAKGACWAALEKLELHRMKDRMYFGEDTVRADVTMDVIDGGVQRILPLIGAGKNWFENRSSLDIILDGKKDLIFTVIPFGGGGRRNVKLALEGLPERPNRTTRLHLDVRCKAADRCCITAQDLGLGEFFPATHKTWKLDVNLREFDKNMEQDEE